MFGNDRFVWNQVLAMMNERYKNNHYLPFLGKYKLNYLLKPLKREYPFLKDSNSSSLQVTDEFLHQAWQRFFEKKAGKLRFHSRKAVRQFYTGKSIVRIAGKRYLKLSKLGYVKSSKTRVLKGSIIKRYTVSLKPTGKFYMAFQVETEKHLIHEASKALGIGQRLG